MPDRKRSTKRHKSNERIPALTQVDIRYNAEVPAPHFSFTADSRSIFISYGGKIHRLNVESGYDEIIPFTAYVHKYDLGSFDYNTFRVSHDPLKIKYIRLRQCKPRTTDTLVVFSPGKSFLSIMDLPAGKPRLLADQPFNQFQPAFSPDGNWIAYVSWCDTVGGYLWRISASGGKPLRLTEVQGQYQNPAWSSDGKFIAIVKGAPKLGDRDDPGRGQLELVSVNNSKEIRVIDDSVALWNDLAFSGNAGIGLYILLSSNGPGIG